jgi:O-acetylhomoserine/O-acetylserine sulfhydrylase-like pyridoxal-dependent enzyme
MTSIYTQSVHAGERGPHPDYTPAVTPIYNSVVYLYDEVDRLHRVLAGEPGYVYSRYGNPTTAALEEAVATLEGGDAAVAFASGMAALHAALLAAGLRAGDTVVAARDLYGVTHALLNEVLAPLGVRTQLVEIARTEEAVAVLEKARPRVFLLETISNPLLVVPDLPALAAAAHRAGARVVVDSTFATPYLLRPLEHGADCVVHSLTKYLAGKPGLLPRPCQPPPTRGGAAALSPGCLWRYGLVRPGGRRAFPAAARTRRCSFPRSSRFGPAC